MEIKKIRPGRVSFLPEVKKRDFVKLVDSTSLCQLSPRCVYTCSKRTVLKGWSKK